MRRMPAKEERSRVEKAGKGGKRPKDAGQMGDAGETVKREKQPYEDAQYQLIEKKKPPCNWFARGLLACCRGYAEAAWWTGAAAESATGSGS